MWEITFRKFYDLGSHDSWFPWSCKLDLHVNSNLPKIWGLGSRFLGSLSTEVNVTLFWKTPTSKLLSVKVIGWKNLTFWVRTRTYASCLFALHLINSLAVVLGHLTLAQSNPILWCAYLVLICTFFLTTICLQWWNEIWLSLVNMSCLLTDTQISFHGHCLIINFSLVLGL